MRSMASKLMTDPTRAARAGLRTGAPKAGHEAKLDPVDAIALRYLERMLGHPPTRDDADLLPGIDVSDLT